MSAGEAADTLHIIEFGSDRYSSLGDAQEAALGLLAQFLADEIRFGLDNERYVVPLAPGTVFWAYCRDSGGEDQDITSQKAAVLEYIDQHNLVLQRLFVDEARPGSSVVGRDALEEMIYLSRREPRPVEGVILWSFSRFARNQLDAQFFKADLRRRGYQIVSMTDDLPGGDFDLIIEALYDWKHEQYLKDLSCNTRRGLRELAKQGYAPGGFPPRGYKAERVQIGVKRNGQPRYASKWVPDEEYWDRAKQAFEMWAEGKSLLEIHNKTHLFKSRQQYSYMLKNRTYWGVKKSGDLQVEGVHPAIADVDTLSAVEARNRRQARRANRGKRWPEGNEHPSADLVPSCFQDCLSVVIAARL